MKETRLKKIIDNRVLDNINNTLYLIETRKYEIAKQLHAKIYEDIHIAYITNILSYREYRRIMSGVLSLGEYIENEEILNKIGILYDIDME